MRWIEVTVNARSGGVDIVCDALSELGVTGMVVEDETDFKSFFENNRQYWDYVDDELESRFAGISRVKFYLADDAEGKKTLENLRASLPYEISETCVQDSDWENGWRKFYKPIEVGERLLILPEWESAPAGGHIELRLDPGLCFGTGSHPTTRMCLEFLEEYIKPGARALDLGCGSGILGIGAVLLGCDFVSGCDVDPEAPRSAAANAALNGINADRFEVFSGDILTDASLRRRLGAGYDIVLANIVADVIIPLSEYALSFMADGGVLICSGIIEGRQDEVVRSMARCGLEPAARRCVEDWHCFVFKASQ